jgi:acyl-coenzyme A synthetase/AMP-(fatty) acid ligase
MAERGSFSPRKELIKVSGYQVAPAELEAVLATHPAVADAAVLRRPDPASGEVPVAVVVPRPGADPGPDELLAWVAARVEPHKRVRAVRFADAIPRTRSGKLLRRALADQDTYPTASGPRMRASSAFSSLPTRMATLEK